MSALSTLFPAGGGTTPGLPAVLAQDSNAEGMTNIPAEALVGAINGVPIGTTTPAPITASALAVTIAFNFPPFTVDAHPPASDGAGLFIVFTDLPAESTCVLAYSDGTDWRRVSDDSAIVFP
jgi:hypothetical protein